MSVLDHLEGMGPKRRAALWKRFGSLDAMREASIDDLAAVDGMNRVVAERVHTFLQGDLQKKQELLDNGKGAPDKE